MTTNRTPINRPPLGRITPEVIEAWHACDEPTLGALLHLKVWQRSPLPAPEISGYGSSEDSRIEDEWGRQSLELQRELLRVAGWPRGCRAVYETKLRKAREWAAYNRKLVRNPALAGIGTGCDLKSLRADLAKAQQAVRYREQLLAGLGDV
jgi:hypothetical protein